MVMTALASLSGRMEPLSSLIKRLMGMKLCSEIEF